MNEGAPHSKTPEELVAELDELDTAIFELINHYTGQIFDFRKKGELDKIDERHQALMDQYNRDEIDVVTAITQAKEILKTLEKLSS